MSTRLNLFLSAATALVKESRCSGERPLELSYLDAILTDRAVVLLTSVTN